LVGHESSRTGRENEFVYHLLSSVLAANLHNEEEGRKAIATFLDKLPTARKVPKLPKTISAMIRNIQPFLPEAATTNRALAKACFLISPMTYMCRFHQTKAKRQGKIDGDNELPGEYQVTGVAYRRVRVSKRIGVFPQVGYFSCGCSEEDVLWDFFFWKTWSITSPTTQVTEGWLDQALDPRARAFVAGAFREALPVVLDEMYTGDRSILQHRQFQLTMMIERMQDELDELTAYMERADEEVQE
jgi:hypothetical protein